MLKNYMAVIRNLHNILKHEVSSELIDRLAKEIADAENVRRSKQFPYRFLSAYKVLESEAEGDAFARGKLMTAVSDALELSVANIPHWKGKTFVTTDNSGSMSATVTEKSKMSRTEVGNIMGALAYRVSDSAIASVFGTRFAVVPLNVRSPVMENAQKLIETDVDSSTNAYLALEYLIENKVDVDRIMMFSDMQCYDSFGGWLESREPQTTYGNTMAAQLKYYKRKINPDVFTYSFDLAGYGTIQFPEDEKRVCLLTGFSDRVFDFIKGYEEFGTGMADKIGAYSPFSTTKSTKP